jgi:DNA-binding Lrp family transcriptional regulator
MKGKIARFLACESIATGSSWRMKQSFTTDIRIYEALWIGERGSMKDAEFRLISELMKNCCRSDRELAKAMGVSQPTVSRTKARLEKEGYILEYTIIPDFKKLGYHLFSLTFFAMNKGMSSGEMRNAVESGLRRVAEVPSNVVLIERGIGLHFDSFMASFHKDYSSYTSLMDKVRTSKYIDLKTVESFIVDLDDDVQYRYLTYSTLAKHLLETNVSDKS